MLIGRFFSLKSDTRVIWTLDREHGTLRVVDESTRLILWDGGTSMLLRFHEGRLLDAQGINVFHGWFHDLDTVSEWYGGQRSSRSTAFAGR